MMNKVVSSVVLALLVTLTSGVAFAQNASEALREKLLTMENFNAVFNQVVVDSEGNAVQQSAGKLWLQRARKMRYQAEQPDNVLLVSNGDVLWHFDEFLEQVTIYPLASIITGNPVMYLTEPDNDAWKLSEITLLEDGRFMIVAGEDSQLASMILDFSSSQLQSLEVVDVTGQVSTFTFSEQGSLDWKEDVFSFDIPDGMDVDDQR